MRWGATVLLAMALPAWAGEQPSGCAWLCGTWSLDAAASESPASILDSALEKQPRAAGQREQLLAALTAPASVTLAEQGKQILIQVPGQPVRRLLVDRAHTRVDEDGTTEIESTWRRDDSLQVTESRSRRDLQAEVYALQPDGTLVITLEVERPGLKRVRVRAVYRRS